MFSKIIKLSTVGLLIYSLTFCCVVNSENLEKFTINSDDYYSYKLSYSSANTAEKPISISASNTGLLIDDTGAAILPEGESINISFEVPEAACYALKFEYLTFDNGTEPISISCKMDDHKLFDEFNNISLPRYFYDSEVKRGDNQNNQYAKEIIQKTGRFSYTLKNTNNTEKALLYLESGSHQIEIYNNSDEFGIYEIVFDSVEICLSYDEYIEKYSDVETVNHYEVYEAENTSLKSAYNLIQLIDNSSAKVSPNDPVHDVVNYVGGNNWDQPGEEITWTIDVPKDGMYQIGINYKQSYSLNTSFYRELKIDGNLPFTEAAAIRFPYALNWEFITLGDGEKPYLFFLTKGQHTLTFSVTLGELSSGCAELENIIYDIAELYRQIVMITGDSPDSNRDYNLFDRIENMAESLSQYIISLENIVNDFSLIFESDSASQIATINSMIDVMQKMLNHKYSAHKYVNRYYDCYSSISSMLYELSSMPLDFDRIYVGSNFKNVTASFLDSIKFSFEKFFLSFVDTYDIDDKSEENKTITLWVNWGRDQSKVLKYLIQSEFTDEYSINVDIKITNATLTHAALSGNGPDCQLYVSRSEPVNLAMRDFVYDLSQFNDFEEIAARFKPNSFECYRFEDGIYALPDSETFFTMFIRNDIFEELRLEVPKTWDEFIQTAVLLLRQNMQVGLPYTQITDMTQVNTGVGALSIYPTLLVQNEGSLYSDDFSKVELLSEKSVDAFIMWTDFYTKYGFSQTYDFFSRFRLGLMPMAIQTYTQYATLIAAAPEITEYWEMYELPGMVMEDGSINNITTSGGTGAVILADSKYKNEAWQFLKWWTSADTQYNYGNEVENILGASARVATSNVEALQKYSWRKTTLNSIMSQWDKVVSLPEVPGGYYVSRVLDQAFWNVTNAAENPKDMLIKWSDIAQTEITHKREQYNIGD